MSKQVRWQVPFRSVSNEQYRVDIYDEGWAGSVTILQGGEHPIETSEDQSDDYFAPIRPTTGTLRVIDTNGTLLAALMPSDNLARPVRLIHIAANNTETIVWQGFLSCEAYSQDYTAVAQEVELPLNGVLEAMGSVTLQPANAGLKKVREAIYEAIYRITEVSGMSCWVNVLYSGASWMFLDKYINTSIFYDSEENLNENMVTYETVSISAKEVLERICTYMGWVAREYGTNLCLCRIGEERFMYRSTLAKFRDGSAKAQEQLTNVDMDDLVYRGTDHSLTMMSGAKSVAVSAKIVKSSTDISIPEPKLNSTEIIQKYINYSEQGHYAHIVISKNITAYSNISMGYCKAHLVYYPTAEHDKTYLGASTMQNTIDHLFSLEESYHEQSSQLQKIVYAGAFLAKLAVDDNSYFYGEGVTNGLLVSLLPGFLNQAGMTYIFSIKSLLPTTFVNEYLNLQCAAKFFVVEPIYGDYVEGELAYYETIDKTDVDTNILLSLRVGGSWWNGSAWVNSECAFSTQLNGANFDNNWNSSMGIPKTDGLLIPVNNYISGEIELRIYPPVGDSHMNNGTIADIFFSSLSINGVQSYSNTKDDRSENRYYKLLNTNFKDTIEINTDMASYLNNNPSPSLLMDSTVTPMSSVTYYDSENTPLPRRPERDLLERMKRYYSYVRRRTNLIIKNITANPCTIKVVGIEANKSYIPVAQDKDWIMDTTNLMLMEEHDITTPHPQPV